MAKSSVEKRKPEGILDYVSLAVTTFGVGYLPLAPGTYGSLVAVGFYALLASSFASFRYSTSPNSPEAIVAAIHAVILVAFLLFILLGIWAASRSDRIARKHRRAGSGRRRSHRSACRVSIHSVHIFVAADRCRLSAVSSVRYLEAIPDRQPPISSRRHRNLRRRLARRCLRRSLLVDHLRDKFVDMILHVLPGDATVETFKASSIEGDIAVCRECLVVGDVSAIHCPEFWENRARFLAAN